jgi:hypothetical protein
MPSLDIEMQATDIEISSPISGDTLCPGRSWRLEHDYLREGIKEPQDQGPVMRRVGNCTEWKRQHNKVSAYYEKQSELLDGLKEIDELLRNEGNMAEHNAPEKHVSLAINLSNASNIILLAAKIPLCVITGSLAIITSVLDSILDLFVGLLLWVARKAVKNENKYKYPIGKARMQPLGIVVFAAIMGTASLQILIIGFEQITSGKTQPSLPPIKKEGMEIASLLTIIIMGLNIIIKFLLWLFCRRFDNDIVKVLTESS